MNDRKNISYKEQYENIYENQQAFITAYDIYNTIANIIYGDKYYLIENMKDNKNNSPKTKHGISLFMKIDNMSRNPSKYKGINRNICI